MPYGDNDRFVKTVMNSKAERGNQHYLLGLEVLKDMYTSAACSGLIAGLSQVSIAARIQKKSYNQKYEDIVILNKGINYHQKIIARMHKKAEERRC